MKLKSLVLILAAILTTAASAQNGPPPQGGGGQGAKAMGQEGGGHHRGPPPEAFAACQGKASGAVCSFTGRQNEKLTGTCFVPPAGGPGGAPSKPAAGGATGTLVCRPDRMGHGMGGPGMGGQGMGGPGGGQGR